LSRLALHAPLSADTWSLATGAATQSEAPDELFPVRCNVEILTIDDIDLDLYGVVVKVHSDARSSALAFQKIEVQFRTNPNFWPVHEFVVWRANR